MQCLFNQKNDTTRGIHPTAHPFVPNAITKNRKNENLRQNKSRIFNKFLFQFLFFVLCFSTSSDAYTVITDPITENATWTTSGSPYWIQNTVVINPGVTLTIQADVVVKFDLGLSLLVLGDLNSQGTEGHEVVFTSILDDSVGGDTNGDADATGPTAGNWGEINIANAAVILDYCKIRYGGYTGKLINCTVPCTIDHCELEDSLGTAGIYMVATGGTVSNCTLRRIQFQSIWMEGSGTVSNCLIEQSGNGIIIQNGAGTISGNTIRECFMPLNFSNDGPAVKQPAVTGNTITENIGGIISQSGYVFPTYSGNTINNNTHQYILVSGDLNPVISQTFSWDESLGLPYVISGTLYVGPKLTLTIPAGMVVKFVASSSYQPYQKARMVVDGVLDVQGAAGNEVVFTSFLDDTAGGDTNADLDTTAPAAGDWGYIKINNAGVTLDHCKIRYGGSYQDGGSGPYQNYMVWCTQGCTIDHCELEDSSGTAGIYIAATGGTVSNCTLRRIHTQVIWIEGSGTISNCLIEQSGIGISIKNGAGTISGNTIRECLMPLYFSNDGPAVKQPAVTGNTITENIGGIISQSGYVFPTYSGNTINNNTHQYILVSGDLNPVISQTFSWDESLGLPYVISGTLYVGPKLTLTIPAGMVVKFVASSSYQPYQKARMVVDGVLDVQGAAGNEVVFTSFLDDTAGGDTNADLDTTAPAAGDWGYIKINNAGVTLDHCKIRYGGSYQDGGSGPYQNYMVWCTQGCTIDHCELEDSSGTAGIYIAATGGTVSNCTLRRIHTQVIWIEGSGTISNCLIEQSGIGISIKNGAGTISGNTIRECLMPLYFSNDGPAVKQPAVTGNTITENIGGIISQSGYVFPTYSGNTINNNTHQYILVSGDLNPVISQTFSWDESLGLPYVISGTLYVGPKLTLTIPAGMVVKFVASSSYQPYQKARMVVDGVLDVQGAAGNEVVFTSFLDDTAGGDTNADLDTTAPAAGDWGYIKINNAGVTLDHCKIRYGDHTKTEDRDPIKII